MLCSCMHIRNDFGPTNEHEEEGLVYGIHIYVNEAEWNTSLVGDGVRRGTACVLPDCVQPTHITPECRRGEMMAVKVVQQNKDKWLCAA